MVRFFETLKDFNSYDEEVFPCELVVSIDTVTQNLFRRCSHGFFFFFFFTKPFLTLLTRQQQGWSLSVELVIGGRGIRQRTQKNSAVGMMESQVTQHTTIIFRFVDFSFL